MRWIVLALAALLAFAGAMWRGAADNFLVQHIEIEGLHRVGRAELRHLSDIRNGTYIWAVDPRSLSERLARHPWVERAVVERDWPDTIHVAITEHEPIALLDYNGHLAYVDREAGPFVEAASDDVDYPVIRGIDHALVAHNLKLLPLIVSDAVWLLSELDKRHYVAMDVVDSIVFHRYRGFSVILMPSSGHPPSEIEFAFGDYMRQLDHLGRWLPEAGSTLQTGVRVDLSFDDSTTVTPIATQAASRDAVSNETR